MIHAPNTTVQVPIPAYYQAGDAFQLTVETTIGFGRECWREGPGAAQASISWHEQVGLRIRSATGEERTAERLTAGHTWSGQLDEFDGTLDFDGRSGETVWVTVPLVATAVLTEADVAAGYLLMDERAHTESACSLQVQATDPPTAGWAAWSYATDWRIQ